MPNKVESIGSGDVLNNLPPFEIEPLGNEVLDGEGSILASSLIIKSEVIDWGDEAASPNAPTGWTCPQHICSKSDCL